MPDLNAEISLPRKIMRGILLALLLAVFVFALRWLKNSGLLERALQWIQSLGPWGPVMFILIYLGAVICSVPASILTLGAGFAFGMIWGNTALDSNATSLFRTTKTLISRAGFQGVRKHTRLQARCGRYRPLKNRMARTEHWRLACLHT